MVNHDMRLADIERAGGARVKVVFLDFDGVLTVELDRPGRGSATKYRFSDVSRSRVERLNQLCEATGAVVVVSSTWKWRGLPGLADLLELHGFRGRVIDVTPTLPGSASENRGREIAAWLDGRKDVEAFVVLDDGAHGIFLVPRVVEALVQTPSEVGLQDAHVEDAVRRLSGGAR